MMMKAGEDTDSGVIIHPWQCRRYPAKILNDLDFADDIAMLESSSLLHSLNLLVQLLQQNSMSLSVYQKPSSGQNHQLQSATMSTTDGQ